MLATQSLLGARQGGKTSALILYHYLAAWALAQDVKYFLSRPKNAMLYIPYFPSQLCKNWTLTHVNTYELLQSSYRRSNVILLKKKKKPKQNKKASQSIQYKSVKIKIF